MKSSAPSQWSIPQRRGLIVVEGVGCRPSAKSPHIQRFLGDAAARIRSDAIRTSVVAFGGVFGSMTLVTPQTALQRVVPNAALGRVSAIFFTAEALATLASAVMGPALADATSFWTMAVASCVVSTVGALIGLALLPVSYELLPARREAPTG